VLCRDALSRRPCFLGGDADVLGVVDRLRDKIANVVVVERVDDAIAISLASDKAEVAKQAELMRGRRLL